MIADPVNIDSGQFYQLCLDNIGSDIFVCGTSGDLIFCSFIVVRPTTVQFRGTDNFFLFRIQRYLNEFEFIIDGNVVSGEHWTDVMVSDYSDHFSWFLFHPEYLS